MEIQLIHSFNHPFIIEIYEWFEDEERVYQILEYCKGGDLLTEVNKRKAEMTRFTEKQVAFIMHQLTSAVHYLHARKIIHRDIKLENVLFVSGPPGVGCGKLKLIDFGAAVVLNLPKDKLVDKFGTS